MSTVVLPTPKQIRFVNNEGRPPAKRRRVDAAYVAFTWSSSFAFLHRTTLDVFRALERDCANVYVTRRCQTCRKRKIRCDGKRPQCSTCKENRHICLGYEAAPLNSGAAKNTDAKNNAADDEDDDDIIHEDIKPKIPPPTARRVDAKLHRVLSEEHRASEDSAGYGDQSPGAGVENTTYTDDGQNSQTLNRRVPYFRWFGPTAIVRGFKQMVVSVGHPGRKMGPTSLSSG